MTTLEELRKEKLNGDSLRSGVTLPAVAKYYYNADGEVTMPNTTERPAPRPMVMNEPPAYAPGFLPGSDDLLPTKTTLRMLKTGRKPPEKPFDDELEVKFSVNAKGRLMFAVYAVLVLALILVIVFNAIGIERQKNENAGLAAEVAMAAAEAEALRADAAYASLDSTVREKAYALGMAEKDGVKADIELPEYAVGSGQT
jgi:hypothetical protein